MAGFGTTSPRLLTLDEPDPFLRGLARGTDCAADIAACWQVYASLFAVNGIAERDVRREALGSLRAVDDWAPAVSSEIRGTAAGAGIPEWQVAALNARTEILSMSAVARPGECSTIISVQDRPSSAQTWDWHVELADLWHLQRLVDPTGGSVGLTEYGILGKIGMNAAGVGVHLNVLGHREDHPGGVPVHVVAAHVLQAATSLDEAVDILLDAPVRSSSAISVVTEEGALIVELSPVGPAIVGTEEPYLLHTNHFLDRRLAVGEKTELYQPDSQQRVELLRSRCREAVTPSSPLDLVDHLCSTPEDGAALCCIPDPAAGLGARWATLATVALQPSRRAMLVSPGTPLMATREDWLSLLC